MARGAQFGVRLKALRPVRFDLAGVQVGRPSACCCQACDIRYVVSLKSVETRHRVPARVIALVVIATVAVLLIVGGRILSTHDRYGQWAWTPSANPPKIQFLGKEYDRAGNPPGGSALANPHPASVPSGFVARGHTASGAIIYAGPGSSASPSPIIYVQSNEHFVGYGCNCGGD